MELVQFQWVAPNTQVTPWATCNRALFMCLKCQWVFQGNTVKLSTRDLNQVSPELRVCRSLGFVTYSSARECYSLTNYLRIMRPNKGWKRQPATWPRNLATIFSETTDNRQKSRKKFWKRHLTSYILDCFCSEITISLPLFLNIWAFFFKSFSNVGIIEKRSLQEERLLTIILSRLYICREFQNWVPQKFMLNRQRHFF